MSKTQRDCCANAETLWSRCRLPEISKFLKIGDGYVIAATGQVNQVQKLTVNSTFA